MKHKTDRGKTTSILHFSDVHFGSEDKDALSGARAFALTLKPDLFLLCGDITQSGRTDEFKAAAAWIRSFPCPKLITPGNHDTPMFNIWHRVFHPFKRYNRYIQPLSEPFFKDGNVMIAPHNTARGIQAKFDWSVGRVNLSKLKKDIIDLHASSDGSLKMLAVHHPLIYPSISPLDKETRNGPAAIKMLSKSKIDAVLSGHIHAPFVAGRKLGGSDVLSIGSGTLSTRQRGKPASFNHILINEDALSIKAYDWVSGEYVGQESWVAPRAQPAPSQHAEIMD